MRFRVVLVGGGSGGHFYPLVSIAHALRREDDAIDLVYLGPDPYDARALEGAGVRFIRTGGGKQRRYASLLNAFDALRTMCAIIPTLVKLFILYPDVIISKGSYTSVPVILAGAFLKIPIIVHESDTRPGRANLLGARFAHTVAISFEHVRAYFPKSSIVFTGIPMRPELLAEPRPNVHELLGIDPNLGTVLIVGGSQGAERLNDLVLRALDELLLHYNVIHITGTQHIGIVTDTARALMGDTPYASRYHPVAFVDDPELYNDMLHAAHVVVSRAGTGSIYEIAAHGKPSILVPIPESISHDQRTNAYAYAEQGGAVVIEEENLTEHLLSSEIDRIMGNPDIAQAMSDAARAFSPQDGGKAIAAIALTIARSHS